MNCRGSSAAGFEPCLQRRDTGILRGDAFVLCGEPLVRQRQPSGQRRDQRVLLGVAQLGGCGQQRHPPCRIELGRDRVKNFLTRAAKASGRGLTLGGKGCDCPR